MSYCDFRRKYCCIVGTSAPVSCSSKTPWGFSVRTESLTNLNVLAVAACDPDDLVVFELSLVGGVAQLAWAEPYAGAGVFQDLP